MRNTEVLLKGYNPQKMIDQAHPEKITPYPSTPDNPVNSLTGLQAQRFIGTLVKTGKFKKFCENPGYRAEDILKKITQ